MADEIPREYASDVYTVMARCNTVGGIVEFSIHTRRSGEQCLEVRALI